MCVHMHMHMYMLIHVTYPPIPLPPARPEQVVRLVRPGMALSI